MDGISAHASPTSLPSLSQIIPEKGCGISSKSWEGSQGLEGKLILLEGEISKNPLPSGNFRQDPLKANLLVYFFINKTVRN